MIAAISLVHGRVEGIRIVGGEGMVERFVEEFGLAAGSTTAPAALGRRSHAIAAAGTWTGTGHIIGRRQHGRLDLSQRRRRGGPGQLGVVGVGGRLGAVHCGGIGTDIAIAIDIARADNLVVIEPAVVGEVIVVGHRTRRGVDGHGGREAGLDGLAGAAWLAARHGLGVGGCWRGRRGC